MKSGRPSDAALLTAYLEGEVTASERLRIEAQLRDSAEARRTLERLRNVSELLGDPAPELESIDLTARVRAAVRRPAPLPARRARSFAPLWLGGVAACVGALALFSLQPLQPQQLQPEDDSSEFHAKSNLGTLSEGNRWAGIQIFRVRGSSAPERLGARMDAGDGLVFSYTNLGAQPFQYLMIFAVDGANQVRWFYPAYERIGTNPESIAIERGRANVPLGEMVQHDFANGSLSVYALFTNVKVNVLQIEDWVKEHGAPAESPVRGGVLQRVDTQVAR